MERKSHGTPVLFEITIVVLFFALSATVVMGVFLNAHQMSRDAAALSSATYAAQDLAEALSGLDDPEEYLTSVGFERGADGAWGKTDQSLALNASLTAQPGPSGLLWQGWVQARVREQAVQLPLAWYVPGGEVA